MAYLKILDNKHSSKVTIDYIKNPDKTNDELIFTNSILGYEHKHFQATKDRWNSNGNVKHHHLVQAFKPGEIQPEDAFKLAKELAATKLKGFEYVISTHTDEEHVHTHIVFNSVNYETGKKFSRNKAKLLEMRQFSDFQCVRDGYSIIEPEGLKFGMSYKEWLEINNGTSWKQQIRDKIDSVIEYDHVIDYESFVKELKRQGIVINDKNSDGTSRKYVTYRLPGMKRNARDRSLGIDYFRNSIENRIIFRKNTGLTVHASLHNSNLKQKYKRYYPRKNSNLFDNIINLIAVIIATSRKIKTGKIEISDSKNKAIKYFETKINDLNNLLKFMDRNDIYTLKDMDTFVDEKFEECYKQEQIVKDIVNLNEFMNNEVSSEGLNKQEEQLDNLRAIAKEASKFQKILKDTQKQLDKEKKIIRV